MKKRRLTVLRVVLTVLCVAIVSFIFYHSSLDAADSTVQSDSVKDGLLELLRALGIHIELTDRIVRKTAHFVEYFALGGMLSLTAFAYLLRRGRMLLLALSLGAAVAVVDELIQTGSAGRSCEIGDMALDFSAVLTAALIVTAILTLIKRHREKKQLKEGIQGE